MSAKKSSILSLASGSASRLVVFFLSAIVFIHCGDSVTQNQDSAFPEKLFPYEVTFDSAAFAGRRDALVKSLAPGSMAFVTTNALYLRNGDVNYDFRPSSTFYYLTGFEEPNAAAILRRKSDGRCEFLLFVEARDSAKTQMLGPVWGPDRAKKFYGADSAYAISSLPKTIQTLLAADTVLLVYTNLAENDSAAALFRAAGGKPSQITDLYPLTDGLRFIKDSQEIRLIQKSVDVSVQAFTEVMKALKPDMFEFEIESVLDLIRRVNGCPRTSFTTIVASGPNISTIHYTANNRQMRTGDLVLIDFGTEYGYYAADLARTLPVSGTFTAEQAAVYDIVLKAQDSSISLVKPGVNFYDLFQVSWSVLIDGLLQQGIITGDKKEIMASKRYLEYAPTGLGHPIGLDVHDPLAFDLNWKPTLNDGVMLALEPGIYLKPDDKTVAEAYRGITVRIEDNIRVTSEGHEVLSSHLPRSRKQIEALMRSH